MWRHFQTKHRLTKFHRLRIVTSITHDVRNFCPLFNARTFLIGSEWRGLAIISTLFSRSNALNSKSSNRPLILATCNAIEPAGCRRCHKIYIKIIRNIFKAIACKAARNSSCIFSWIKIPPNAKFFQTLIHKCHNPALQ